MTTTLAPGLARKIKKVLDTKTESQEVLGSLSTLSSFYEDNSTASRRKLRGTIEQQALGNNVKFLQAAEEVIKALNTVQSDLDSLSSACGRIGSGLSASKAATADMLEEVEKLQRALENTQVRSGLVGRFLEQYQLTEDEVEALNSETIDLRFFGALERVRRIHTNCRGLLRTHHQRAGLELMDAMWQHQEHAYDRLCRWVQRQCRQLLESYGDAEVDPLLQRAVAALKERPVLYQYCTEEVITARHNAVLSSFIVALTKGGPGGFPRPMEMHAHDARRYVADMLAWVHQALASERELLVTLFGEDEPAAAGVGPEAGEAASQPDKDAAAAADEYGGEEVRSLSELLDMVFESVCKPLEMRIDSVLNSLPPPLVCFQISQLLSFYTGTIQGMVGPHAQLVSTMRGSNDRTRRIFGDQLRVRGDKLLRYPPPPPRDLGPPPQVSEALQQLSELMDAFESSYDASSAASQEPTPPGQPISGAEADFAPVLALVLDPLVEACERSSEALVADSPARVDEGLHLDPAAPRVYLINCLTAVEAVLAGRRCADNRARKLAAAVEGHVAALVGLEAGRLMGACGLAEVLERVRLHQSAQQPGPMANDDALALPRAVDALNRFFAQLSDPAALPEFERLQVPRVRAVAVTRVVGQLVEGYEAVHTALQDPANGYDSAEVAAAVNHSPRDVRVLLGATGTQPAALA